jgi:hypothetical protein
MSYQRNQWLKKNQNTVTFFQRQTLIENQTTFVTLKFNAKKN